MPGFSRNFCKLRRSIRSCSCDDARNGARSCATLPPRCWIRRNGRHEPVCATGQFKDAVNDTHSLTGHSHLRNTRSYCCIHVNVTKNFASLQAAATSRELPSHACTQGLCAANGLPPVY